MNKPICELLKNNVEHLVVRVFNVIKENYSLEEARKFYKNTLMIRYDQTLNEYEAYEAVSNVAQKYVELLW